MQLTNLISANNWYALLHLEDGDQALPLIGWGSDCIKVVGLVVDPNDARRIVPANSLDGFVGYEDHSDELSSDFFKSLERDSEED